MNRIPLLAMQVSVTEKVLEPREPVAKVYSKVLLCRIMLRPATV